jgi:hypothetical protein
MDLRSNPRAVAAARRIQAETGFDVLDDAAVEQMAALCAARAARARRLAALSAVLAVVVLVAFTVAVVLGQVHVYELILGPMLFLVNAIRLAAALAAVRRLDRIPQTIEAARAEVRAAAAGPAGPSGLTGAPWPPSDVARWN